MALTCISPWRPQDFRITTRTWRRSTSEPPATLGSPLRPTHRSRMNFPIDRDRGHGHTVQKLVHGNLNLAAGHSAGNPVKPVSRLDDHSTARTKYRISIWSPAVAESDGYRDEGRREARRRYKAVERPPEHLNGHENHEDQNDSDQDRRVRTTSQRPTAIDIDLVAVAVASEMRTPIADMHAPITTMLKRRKR